MYFIPKKKTFQCLNPPAGSNEVMICEETTADLYKTAAAKKLTICTPK